MQSILLTLIAMIAFAANSIFCRAALEGGSIDPTSFTFLRIVSGAAVLWLIVKLSSAQLSPKKTTWSGAVLLFVYMISFSFAYVTLDTGIGALILAVFVQLTMFVYALRKGETFPLIAWGGLIIAITGFVYLLLPGLTAPSPLGTVLIILSGIAWGGYCLSGKESRNPLEDTAQNFLRSIPFAIVAILSMFSELRANSSGIFLAIASGALASGAGYVIWYAALRRLSTTTAATVQLSAPVIATLGGVLFLEEPLTKRILISTILTLTGVALVLIKSKNEEI